MANRLGLTQRRIATATGVSQPQVSRLLSGRCIRRSEGFDQVCNYVNRQAKAITVEDVRRCTTLVNALAFVWDGSQAHAEALTAVIRSLGALPSPVTLGNRKSRRTR